MKILERIEKSLNRLWELELPLPEKWRRVVPFTVPAGAALAICMLILSVFAATVELKPEVGENFFFSSDDPQMQAEKEIQKMFFQDPQIFLSARGDISSPAYFEKVRRLSEELTALPEVISVFSLSHGPGTLKDAREGPLWSRLIIAEDGQSTLLSAFIRHVPPEQLVPKIEALQQKYSAKDFEIKISGESYINELLRRNLFKDLKVFTAAAFLVFGLILFVIFRSLAILTGTFIACVSASMLTLVLCQVTGIETGPLNANLSTIVFVLTLSHAIFLTFQWKQFQREGTFGPHHPVFRAVKETFPASFWSMLTTFLGFLSLLLVKATPLRQLGAAGAVGTLVAMVCAYLLFPPFLGRKSPGKKDAGKVRGRERQVEPFFYRQHVGLFVVFVVLTVGLALNIMRLNLDPSLLAYFKEGSDMRAGLEYIDRNGGSSPLSLVVEHDDGSPFQSRQEFERLWDLTIALESHAEVGSAVSLPILLAQAQMNVIARFLALEWLVDLMETERFGEVAKYFITPDRTRSLVMLRMRESNREEKRIRMIQKLKDIVAIHGLKTHLVGGIYSLQGRMSQLVTSSLVSGLLLLVSMFVVMGWFLSRTRIVVLAMACSLAMIPLCMLGVLGWFKVPLDIIAAPGANIAISIGVDSMIHLLMYVRRHHPDKMTSWASWKRAVVKLWRPILYTAIIIAAGFGIFSLSQFPPTQRFGLMVVMGSFAAPLAALIAFPSLSSATQTFLKKES